MSRFNDDTWDGLPGDQAGAVLAVLCTEVNKLESVLGAETVWHYAACSRPDQSHFSGMPVDQVGDVLNEIARALYEMAYDIEYEGSQWLANELDVWYALERYIPSPDSYPHLNHCYLGNYKGAKEAIELFTQIVWRYSPVSQSGGYEKAVASFNNNNAPTITPPELWANLSASTDAPSVANSAFLHIRSECADNTRSCLVEKCLAPKITYQCDKTPSGTIDSATIRVYSYGDASYDSSIPPNYGWPNESGNYMCFEGAGAGWQETVDVTAEESYDFFSMYTLTLNDASIESFGIVSFHAVSLDESQDIQVVMAGDTDLEDWTEMYRWYGVGRVELTAFPGGDSFGPEEGWHYAKIGAQLGLLSIVSNINPEEL